MPVILLMCKWIMLVKYVFAHVFLVLMKTLCFATLSMRYIQTNTIWYPWINSLLSSVLSHMLTQVVEKWSVNYNKFNCFSYHINKFLLRMLLIILYFNRKDLSGEYHTEEYYDKVVTLHVLSLSLSLKHTHIHTEFIICMINQKYDLLWL